MRQDQAVVFILDALAHERDSLRVYEAAAECEPDKEHKRQLARYRTAGQRRVASLERVCADLGVSLDHLTPARDIIHDISAAHARALEAAAAEADAGTAQIIACECVAFARAKSRANREMLHQIATALPEPARQTLLTSLRSDKEDVPDPHTKPGHYRRELLLRKLGLDLYAETGGSGPGVQACRPAEQPAAAALGERCAAAGSGPAATADASSSVRF